VRERLRVRAHSTSRTGGDGSVKPKRTKPVMPVTITTRALSTPSARAGRQGLGQRDRRVDRRHDGRAQAATMARCA
jgi:hypothetical protein